MEPIKGILLESCLLFIEMSPYLLFGFLIAGILNLLIPSQRISRHFAGSNLRAVLKSTVLGIPLPLCSCGVIPVATHLRKQGASKGSVLSFLIATPTSGVDSILATYSLMGLLFTAFRVVVSFFSGILAGVLTNFLTVEEKPEKEYGIADNCPFCDVVVPHTHSLSEKIKKVGHYAFVDLIADIGVWILIGVGIGGMIGYLVPVHIFERYLSNPLIAYPLMFVLGIPIYICATGSIPIAASLMLKGMTPGAALVFLIVGPATNTTTITVVGKLLGKKVLIIYLLTIIICAFVFGIILDQIVYSSGKDTALITGVRRLLPDAVKVSTGVVLLGLIIFAIIPRRKKEKIITEGLVFRVPEINCEHCKVTLEKALKQIDGVKEVNVNIKRKEVIVVGELKKEKIISAINKAGYNVQDT
ncbi:SO_0444 family Cu/Zn efflux transporter [Candidatus Sumerlaeota bacterium]|nr:SO_0444 family Cu/Zn efflux transporter [Candidatus Sumerlaeota bacterium]